MKRPAGNVKYRASKVAIVCVQYFEHQPPSAETFVERFLLFSFRVIWGLFCVEAKRPWVSRNLWL